MCYPLPGPRCSAHAFDAMEKARQELEGAKSAADREKAAARYRDAQRAYYTTPAGLKYLEHEANVAEKKGQVSRAAKYRTAKNKYSDKRAAQIMQMRVEGFTFSEDPTENDVERCEACGRFANKAHQCPGKVVTEDTNTLGIDKRVDIHRPTVFDPEKYESVSILDTKNESSVTNAVSELAAQGYVLGNGSLNNCGHCGARMRYAALLKRTDVKEYIFVGEQCLDNRFKSGLTAEQFQNLRKKAALSRERMRRDERIDKMVEEHPHLAWLTYPESLQEWGGSMTNSIGFQFRKEGRLTDRQVSAVKEALSRDAEHYELEQERKRQEAEQRAQAMDAPTEKNYTFDAVVLGTRHDPGFGYKAPSVKKLLVQSSDGWKAWMTCPAAIREAKKGDQIFLTADLQQSPDDPKFAFAKRPRRASIVHAAEEQAAE